jgi:hypothetical protein
LDWTDYGIETGTYINGLTLIMTNIYYVSVKVQNGAMMWSTPITSTPVLIIGGNKKGIYRSRVFQGGLIDSRCKMFCSSGLKSFFNSHSSNKISTL